MLIFRSNHTGKKRGPASLWWSQGTGLWSQPSESRVPGQTNLVLLMLLLQIPSESDKLQCTRVGLVYTYISPHHSPHKKNSRCRNTKAWSHQKAQATKHPQHLSDLLDLVGTVYYEPDRFHCSQDAVWKKFVRLHLCGSDKLNNKLCYPPNILHGRCQWCH